MAAVETMESWAVPCSPASPCHDCRPDSWHHTEVAGGAGSKSRALSPPLSSSRCHASHAARWASCLQSLLQHLMRKALRWPGACWLPLADTGDSDRCILPDWSPSARTHCSPPALTSWLIAATAATHCVPARCAARAVPAPAAPSTVSAAAKASRRPGLPTHGHGGDCS